MRRLRKNPVPVRLQVSYEYVPWRELQPAIVVLAAMLRKVELEATQGEPDRRLDRIQDGYPQ